MKSLLVALYLLLSTLVFAQEADTSYWKFGGVTSVTFSQVSLTNWAAGGDNSISLNGFFNVYSDYNKDKISWSNDLEMGYGIIKQGDAQPKKTDDLIIATTQFGYKISNKLFWTTLLDFRTQFYRGIDADGNRISNFMAPGYLLLATGIQWKPAPEFSINWAPVTGKLTIVNDDELAADGAFGVDQGLRDANGNIIRQGSASRLELGTFLKVQYNKENLIQNVNLKSKLELFTNYLENFGEIDVNWQNQLAMKVNAFLSVNIQTQLLYDKDIEFTRELDTGEVISEGDKVQFKSVFGVGLSYNFGYKKE